MAERYDCSPTRQYRNEECKRVEARQNFANFLEQLAATKYHESLNGDRQLMLEGEFILRAPHTAWMTGTNDSALATGESIYRLKY
jgi:hypothetical protein